MCLSNIYKKDGESKELLFKNAATIRIEDGKIIVTDIMGREDSFEGQIDCVDLLENFIVIK